MTAQALANALRLPLYVVRFDSVIGSYLGQTAVHLREIFQYAETAQSVLLFDEIDALGKRRGHPSDVGELDRIVIALMQELEFSESKGLIIATSNLIASGSRYGGGLTSPLHSPGQPGQGFPVSHARRERSTACG